MYKHTTAGLRITRIQALFPASHHTISCPTYRAPPVPLRWRHTPVMVPPPSKFPARSIPAAAAATCHSINAGRYSGHSVQDGTSRPPCRILGRPEPAIPGPIPPPSQATVLLLGSMRQCRRSSRRRSRRRGVGGASGTAPPTQRSYVHACAAPTAHPGVRCSCSQPAQLGDRDSRTHHAATYGVRASITARGSDHRHVLEHPHGRRPAPTPCLRSASQHTLSYTCGTQNLTHVNNRVAGLGRIPGTPPRTRAVRGFARLRADARAAAT